MKKEIEQRVTELQQLCKEDEASLCLTIIYDDRTLTSAAISDPAWDMDRHMFMGLLIRMTEKLSETGTSPEHTKQLPH